MWIRIVVIATFVGMWMSTPAFAQTQNLNLVWDASSSPDVESYRLYVGTAPSAQDAGVYTIPASQTSYAFSATPGVIYYFAVSAVSADGIESQPSAAVSGSIPLLSSLVNRSSPVGLPIIAVQLSASDPDGGTVRFTHTGLPPGLILDPLTGIIAGIPLSPGTFTVTVFASDGLLTGSGSFDWTVRSPGSGDTTAPRVVITSPAPGQSVTSSSVTVSGTASDGGLGDSGILRVTVNGQLASGGTASGSGTANWSRTLTLSGSSNAITVEALDGAGNYSAELFTLTRDVTAPSLAITSHTSGQTVTSGTITLSGTATDSGMGGSGISRVTVNGSNASGGTASGNSNASWSRTVTLSIGNNALTVVATDGAGNTRTTSTTIRYTPPGLAVSLTSNLASPQPPGTSIRFTAAAGGGNAPYQYKWWIERYGVWYVEQDWSSSATLTWAPVSTATFTVAVWVRNAGVTADASQALAQMPFTMGSGGSAAAASPPMSITSLTSDVSSPRALGTPINFSALGAGGSGSYEFKWWVQIGGAWYVAREWNSSANLAWQPTTAGDYVVAVWGRNAGVTADTSQGMGQIAYTITSGSSGSVSSGSPTTSLSITSFTSNVASPQTAGTTVTFTAAAAGGSAPYQFKWWVQSGGVWTVAREWSTSSSLAWRPTSTGTYNVAVWARNAGVTADASQALASAPFVISAASGGGGATPLSMTGLWSNVASPQASGGTITFTTGASGGSGPYQFKWWVLSGGVWSVAQEWSTSTSYTWRPSAAGTYVIAVWARNAGVWADASQALTQTTYTITPGTSGAPTSFSVNISSNASSPQRSGATVVFRANASGGNAPYEYKWWVYDGSTWSVAQDWTTTETLYWRPTTSGTYVVAVWVRNDGVWTDASQVLAQVPYVVTP